MSQEQTVRIARQLLADIGSASDPRQCADIARNFKVNVDTERRRTGRDAVSDFIRGTRRLIERVRFDVKGILADDDWAVIFSDLASKVNATAKMIESPLPLSFVSQRQDHTLPDVG